MTNIEKDCRDSLTGKSHFHTRILFLSKTTEGQLYTVIALCLLSPAKMLNSLLVLEEFQMIWWNKHLAGGVGTNQRGVSVSYHCLL